MTSVKGTRREQAKAETRRLILEAAYELFEKNGFEKTTMRQLAREAGVGLGTIFQHFPDKVSILLTAFREDISSIAYEAVTTMPAAGLRRQLIHTMKPLFDFYTARPALSRVLLKEGLFADKEVTEQLLAQEKEFSSFTIGLCDRAKAEGKLGQEADSRIMADTIWAFYIHVLIKGLRTGEFTAEALMRDMLNLFEHLLAGFEPE